MGSAITLLVGFFLITLVIIDMYDFSTPQVSLLPLEIFWPVTVPVISSAFIYSHFLEPWIYGEGAFIVNDFRLWQFLDFRRVQNVVCVLLGISPASEV